MSASSETTADVPGRSRTRLLHQRLWTHDERQAERDSRRARLEALLQSELRGAAAARPLHVAGGAPGGRGGPGAVLFRADDNAEVKAKVRKELDKINAEERGNKKAVKAEKESLNF